SVVERRLRCYRSRQRQVIRTGGAKADPAGIDDTVGPDQAGYRCVQAGEIALVVGRAHVGVAVVGVESGADPEPTARSCGDITFVTEHAVWQPGRGGDMTDLTADGTGRYRHPRRQPLAGGTAA